MTDMTRVLIVLGAAVKRGSDGKVAPSAALKRRVGAALGAAIPGDLFIVTGSARDGLPSEAQIAAEMLVKAGIPANQILLEPDARNTFENLAFSNTIITNQGLTKRPILLVSDRSHLPRALMIARLLGLPVTGVAAALPNISRLKRFTIIIRELAAFPLSAARALRHRLTQRPNRD